jgi:hypothetical protein
MPHAQLIVIKSFAPLTLVKSAKERENSFYITNAPKWNIKVEDWILKL